MNKHACGARGPTMGAQQRASDAHAGRWARTSASAVVMKKPSLDFWSCWNGGASSGRNTLSPRRCTSMTPACENLRV